MSDLKKCFDVVGILNELIIAYPPPSPPPHQPGDLQIFLAATRLGRLFCLCNTASMADTNI